MRKVLKISIILVILLTMQLQISSCCYAESKLMAANPEQELKPTIEASGEEALLNKVEPIVTVIRTVGIVLSVIALMLIGIKTMTGSIEEKSKYKEALPGYILGVILVAAITFLPTLIYNIVQSTINV